MPYTARLWRDTGSLDPWVSGCGAADEVRESQPVWYATLAARLHIARRALEPRATILPLGRVAEMWDGGTGNPNTINTLAYEMPLEPTPH